MNDNDARYREVMDRLTRVSDPELDEPVTELKFVTGVSIQDDTVCIGFRLPTYWCAANFAFLMADDMRTEVSALPWVRDVRVTLGEHMYGETINTAMARGQSFQEAFGAEADGNLDEVRRVFDVKAFQRRQLALLDQLLDDGQTPERLLSLSASDLGAWFPGPLTDRYLQKRGIVGPDGPHASAFVDEHGEPVGPDRFLQHRRALRRACVNMEFNGALCRGLLAARFDEPEGEPTLLDFVQGAARPNA